MAKQRIEYMREKALWCVDYGIKTCGIKRYEQAELIVGQCSGMPGQWAWRLFGQQFKDRTAVVIDWDGPFKSQYQAWKSASSRCYWLWEDIRSGRIKR